MNHNKNKVRRKCFLTIPECIFENQYQMSTREEWDGTWPYSRQVIFSLGQPVQVTSSKQSYYIYKPSVLVKLWELRSVWEHHHLLACVRNKHHQLTCTVDEVVNTTVSFTLISLLVLPPPLSVPSHPSSLSKVFHLLVSYSVLRGWLLQCSVGVKRTLWQFLLY